MDDVSAWAEIDAILASIDPDKAAWLGRLDAPAPVSSRTQETLEFLVSLEDWAALNQLEELLPALLHHGFDCANFINGVLSDADLQELGVRSSTQRRRILAAVQELPRGAMAVAESMSSATSADWLMRRLRIRGDTGGGGGGGIAEIGSLTVENLIGVTDTELRQRFNLRKLGHRRRVLCCLDNAPALATQQMQRRLLRGAAAAAAAAGAEAAAQNGVSGSSHRRRGSNLSARSSAVGAGKSPSVVMATSGCGLGTGSRNASESESDGDNSATTGGVGRRRRRGLVRRPMAESAGASATLTELLPRRELLLHLPGVSRSWLSSTADDIVDAATAAAGKTAAEAASPGSRPLALPRSRSTDFLAGSGGIGDNGDGADSPDPAGVRASLGSGPFKPTMRAGWPHHPDVLLKDSFSYSVSYLGFRPLVDHTDQAETAQVMQTFRCKSADILKLPRIRLTVCYRGVKFINPDNDMVITEHGITEIYFASQDNTRRANFAYVTKDSVNSVHYCHCFASHSPETAVLIIQTLSEACGLANQLIEFNQLRRQRKHCTRRKGRRH